MIGRIETRLKAAGLVLPLLLGLGCPVHSNVNLTSNHPGYHSDVATVQVISALVGGKNVFIPSTIVVSVGRPQNLSIFNTTDDPHGFAIEGLAIATVLPAGEETLVELPVLQEAAIYRINCHLHPPHRTATLMVAPAD
jgi:hypothetical protein